MLTDVAAFVGRFPFRHVTRGTPEWLLSHMDRLEIDRAWVGDLGALLLRDPAPANVELGELLAHHDRLVAVPTVALFQHAWTRDLDAAVAMGAPAVRVYPQYSGGTTVAMCELAGAAATRGLPMLLTIRLEDGRQRHPIDTAPEPDGAMIRAVARSDPDVRVLVSHASRELIEEVHFGLTEEEASRVLWDIAWLWGPPEDHVAMLLETVGPARFVFGTGMPLRVPDSVVAKVDLLEGGWNRARPVFAENLELWRGRRLS